MTSMNKTLPSLRDQTSIIFCYCSGSSVQLIGENGFKLQHIILLESAENKILSKLYAIIFLN